MMRFEGDLAETLLACAEGRLKNLNVRLSPRAAAAVVLAIGSVVAGYAGIGGRFERFLAPSFAARSAIGDVHDHTPSFLPG